MSRFFVGFSVLVVVGRGFCVKVVYCVLGRGGGYGGFICFGIGVVFSWSVVVWIEVVMVNVRFGFCIFRVGRIVLFEFLVF